MSYYGYHYGSLKIYITQKIYHVSMYVTFYGYIPSDNLVTYYKIRHNIVVSECGHVKACKCEHEKLCAKRGCV